jgi:hypothetical protein
MAVSDEVNFSWRYIYRRSTREIIDFGDDGTQKVITAPSSYLRRDGNRLIFDDHALALACSEPS